VTFPGVSRPPASRTAHFAYLTLTGNSLNRLTGHVRTHPIHRNGHPPLPVPVLWITQWTELKAPNRAVPLTVACPTSACRHSDNAPSRNERKPEPPSHTVPDPDTNRNQPCYQHGCPISPRNPPKQSRKPQAQPAPHRNSPRPPRGTIPLLSSRAVDCGGKRVHRLWITLACPAMAGGRPSADGRWRVGCQVLPDPGLARPPGQVPRSPAQAPRPRRPAALDMSGEVEGLSYAARTMASAGVCPGAARRRPSPRLRTAPRQALVRSPW
jgi:hypothetical protein